jgi:hypothetical protein
VATLLLTFKRAPEGKSSSWSEPVSILENLKETTSKYQLTGSVAILLLTLTQILGGKLSPCSQLVSNRQNL